MRAINLYSDVIFRMAVKDNILNDLIKEISNKIKSPIRRSTVFMSSARRGSIEGKPVIDFNKKYPIYEINSTSRITLIMFYE